MDKQKIKSAEPCKTAKGAPYCKVETYEGQRGTCWDVGYMEILKANIGKDVMISIVENDKGYMTVTELCPVEDSAQTPQFKPQANRSIVNPDRNASIVAQCLTKVWGTDRKAEPQAILDTYAFFLRELA